MFSPAFIPFAHLPSCFITQYNLSSKWSKGVKQVDKDRLLNAANAIQNGSGAGSYHDELEVIIGLIMEASDETIAAVVQDISTEPD